MKKVIKIIFFLGLAWFIIHEAFIILDGLKDETVKSEYALILGNTVHPDGSLSKRLQSRVDKGIALYQDSIVSKIMVSGGLGKEGHFEGTKMAEYLINKGIPTAHIFIDDKGINTQASAFNFAQQFPDATSVIVVSQFFHISRSKLALRKQGIKKVRGAHSTYFESRDLYSLLREFPAYYTYLLIEVSS